MVVTKNEPLKVCLTFGLLGFVHGVHETAALIVLSGMHFKLKSVVLCTISLECGVLMLCSRVPVIIPITSTTYETQSQSG